MEPEQIKEVANSADLLALNAALEGTKAGAAGAGFSLVVHHAVLAACPGRRGNDRRRRPRVHGLA